MHTTTGLDAKGRESLRVTQGCSPAKVIYEWKVPVRLRLNVLRCSRGTITAGDPMTSFGTLNIMQQRDPAKSRKQIFDEAVEQSVLADKLGYYATWYAEHHFSNYGLCPSPLMMVSHLAGLTKRIRLGTAIVVAPLYMPSRLLSEIGLADLLSDGRLELGVGKGYQEFEFERFGIDLKNSADMTSEVLDLIERGLSEQTFSYQGRFFQQPQSTLSCKPLQLPTPPIWYAGGELSHLKRAARNGYTVFMSGALGGVTRLRGLKEQYEKIVAGEGRDPSEARVALSRMAFVTDDRKEADHFIDCARYQQRLALSLKGRRETVKNDYMVQETPFPEEPPFERIRHNLPVGDVETCIENMVNLIRNVKPAHIALLMQVGDMEHRKVMKSMERWMQYVVPGVEKELARAAVAAA
jgi:alkanesulfonate monooxygenase SsuD/methylene tetrahydromethanopterin reductase-like flavin-dependent oxidoreductase (luciferase family)